MRSLTEASDTILFAAAYTKQVTDHITSAPCILGALLGNGLVLFDLFRPVFWGDENVAYRYRRNNS